MAIFVCASVGSFPHLASFAECNSTIVFTKKRLEILFREFLPFLAHRKYSNIYSLSDKKIYSLNAYQFARIPVSGPAYFFEDHCDYLLIAYQRWLSNNSIDCHLLDRYNLDIANFSSVIVPSLSLRVKMGLRGLRCNDITFLQRKDDVRTISGRKEPCLNYYTWTSIKRLIESPYSILRSLGCSTPDPHNTGSILFLDSVNEMEMSYELDKLLKPYYRLITVKPHPNESLSSFAKKLLQRGATFSHYDELPAEIFCFSGIHLVIATRISTAFDAFFEASIPIITLEGLWRSPVRPQLPNTKNLLAPTNLSSLNQGIRQCVDSL